MKQASIFIAFLLLFFCKESFSQTVVGRASAANTVKDGRVMDSLNLYIPRYRDTTTANLTSPNNIGIDTAGAIIYTYDIKGFWYRQHSPKRWVRIVSDNNLSNNFFFDSTCNCYKIDTTSIINIINNFGSDSSITNISIVNDSTIRICYGNGTCVNIGIVTNISNINNIYILSNDSLVVCHVDSAVSECDTISLTPQPIIYHFQNGVQEINANGVVEFGTQYNTGSTLQHDAYFNTGTNKVFFRGYPYGSVPYQFGSEQTPILSPSIVSFENLGTTHGSHNNKLSIGYTDSSHTQYGITFNGTFGNKIGFFDITNLTGLGTLNTTDSNVVYNVGNNDSKTVGIFRHSFDNYNDYAVSIFGLSKNSIVNSSVTNENLDTSLIASFNTDKRVKFHGYGNGRFQINDTTNHKPLTVDASGNVGEGYWFSGGGGGADSTYFLGSLYNKSTWSNLNDFLQVGGTYAVSGGKINFSGGANDYSNILEIARATRLEHWKMGVRIKVTSSLAINGLSIGIRNSNPSFANNFVAWFRPFDGLLRIEKTFNTPLATSSSALTINLTDEIEVTFERDINNFYATARNITTNSAPITVAYRVESLYGGSVLAPSTGYYSIYNIGGTFTLDSLAVESKELVNSDALLLGTSKTVGYYGTTFENRWASRLNQDFNIVVSAGSADQTRQWNDAAAELIALKPKKVIIEAPSNDYRASVSEATIIANYDSLVTALQAAGIQVYHLNYLYETSLDYTSWKTHINATYPSSNIIYTDTLSRRTGFLNADGIHISPDGQQWLYDYINSYFVLKQFHGRPHVPFNELYSTSDGVTVLRTQATNIISQLVFGDQTSSWPNLKVNGSGLSLRNGSDAAYTDFTARVVTGTGGGLFYGNNVPAGSSGLSLQTVGGDAYADNISGGSLAGTFNYRAAAFKFNNGSADLMAIAATTGNVTVSSLRTGITAPATTGTTKMVISDQNGLLSFTTIPTGGFVTADNGLTASTSTNVQLGGTLTATTTIDATSAYRLNVTGSFSQTMLVTNTGSGIGVYATSSTGTAITGVSNGGFGAGVVAQSNGGNAIEATSNGSGVAGQFFIIPSSTNTVATSVLISRGSSGTAANGIGTSVDFYLKDAGAGSTISNQIISKYTDATAKTSQFIITGVNSGTSGDILTLNGNKSIQVNGYGVNTFAGTPTYLLGVDASGNVVETPTGTTGTYLPTATGVTNITGYTVNSGTYWYRVGNTMTVSGEVQIDPTTTGATELDISLPIASALVNAYDLNGTGVSPVETAEPASFEADATNDRVAIKFVAISTANRTYHFVFTYLIK